MDHSMHTPINTTDLTEANMLDATLYGPEDVKIGTISHVHGNGRDASIIVDIGGFLGIGTKSVAISAQDLNFMRDQDGDVHAVTSWSKDDMKALPEHHH
jgi:PRC-barrel domain